MYIGADKCKDQRCPPLSVQPPDTISVSGGIIPLCRPLHTSSLIDDVIIR